MTPAEALEIVIDSADGDLLTVTDRPSRDYLLNEKLPALREALAIVEGVARVREALEAGTRNLSGVSRAAYHYVLSTDGAAAWPAGVETGRICGPLTNERVPRYGLVGELREALWAVRVLDAWAERHIRRAPSPVCLVDERWSVAVPIRVPGGSETRAFYASKPDAARIAAAKALVAEDPTLEPQELT
jgi:hypothetical protein